MNTTAAIKKQIISTYICRRVSRNDHVQNNRPQLR